MPISVPKAFKAELEFALNAAKSAGYGIATNEAYNYVKRHLGNNGVPHQQHSHESSVPSDHVYGTP